MIRPPVAKRRNHRHTHHGITLEDAYYWLRDPAYPDVKDPEIIEYLTAENAYFDARMEAHQPLVTQLFEEIKGRQPAEDASVPHRHGAFWYQWRYQKDAQYRQWLRAPAPAGSSPDAGPWEVILDEIIDNLLDGTLGGEVYEITLANGGLVIEYNDGFDLPADVKQAAEDTIAGLIDGSITTGQ